MMEIGLYQALRPFEMPIPFDIDGNFLESPEPIDTGDVHLLLNVQCISRAEANEQPVFKVMLLSPTGIGICYWPSEFNWNQRWRRL